MYIKKLRIHDKHFIYKKKTEIISPESKKPDFWNKVKQKKIRIDDDLDHDLLTWSLLKF